ncbi:hypothetical protein MRB53_039852 [Persea americana]|nr:hypothetical protein MRB53_039852 [Persea americana]
MTRRYRNLSQFSPATVSRSHEARTRRHLSFSTSSRWKSTNLELFAQTRISGHSQHCYGLKSYTVATSRMVQYQNLAAGLLSLPFAVSADQQLKRQGNYPFKNGTDSSTVLKSASHSPSISSVSSSSLPSTSSSSTTYSIRFTYAPQSESDSASPASSVLSPEPVETGSTNSFKSIPSSLAVSHSIGTSHSSISQQHLSGSASYSSKSQGHSSAASTAHSGKSQEHLSASAASSHSSKPPKHLVASASRSISGHASLITGSSYGTAGCGGRTINVASASLDWWYDRNVYDVVSVLSYQHDSAGQVTGWTIIPGPTTFALSIAISAWTCASTKVPTTNTHLHSTYSAFPCTTTPVHKAAATTAIIQTGYQTDLPATGTGFDDVPNVVSMPTPAAFTFGRKTISRGVPFVQINGYEVTSRTSVRGTGGFSCSAVTKTHNLTTPYVFTYTGPNPSIAADHDVAITGKLDEQFLSVIKQTAVAGSFTAVPTVVLVVEEVFAASVPVRWFPGDILPSSTAVYTYYTGARTGSAALAFTTPAPSALATFAGGTATALVIEASAVSLDTPSANQLPENAHSTTITDQGYNLYTALVGTPKVQPSDQVLLIPTTNHGTTGTLLSAVQTPTSPADANAQNGGTNNGSPNNGGSVNVQSNGAGSNGGQSNGGSNGGGSNGGGSNGGSNGGGNGGNSGSGSDSPANALQVLNQAMGSAIMAGIGSNSAAATITVLGNVATQTNARAVVVGGQTVAPGSTVTVGGTVISMPSPGTVVVGGQTTQLPAGSGQVLTFNGATLTATSVEAFPIAGQTLAAGGSPITISNQQVSLNAAGNVLVVGSSTSIIGQAKIISLNGQTFVENSQTQFVLGPGKTTPVAVAANPTAAADAVTARPVITVDGQTYSPSAGKYVISGQTLSAGGAITFNGLSGKETVSLDKSGTVMVDVISGKSTTSTLSPLPNLTIGGKVYTPTGGSYVIAGQTLTPGSSRTVTIDGSTYILGLSATPTVLEIDQVGSSGKITATSYETLTTGTSSTAVSSATGADKGATGEASTINIAMLSSILASGSLLLAILL